MEATDGLAGYRKWLCMHRKANEGSNDILKPVLKRKPIQKKNPVGMVQL